MIQQLLEIIGSDVTKNNDVIIIDTTKCDNPEAPYNLVKTMRASFYVLGPLISRFKYAKVSLPGGCAWGPRPIDFHLSAFEKLGAEVKLKSGYIITKGKLHGGMVKFPKPSVGATGNVLMSCINLNEEVIIENAAMEPEIVDLCNFLTQIGISISGIGTDVLTIKGNDLNNIINFEYEIIPDRIEAGTFLIACAATGGCVRLNNINSTHLSAIIGMLSEAGMNIKHTKNSIVIKSSGEVKSINLKTDIYPGFPTDLQAQWIALMCKANGQTIVEDTIYLDRFTHVPELNRLGANISVNNNVATIFGNKKLFGTNLMSTDIRASASLIIAAMCSEGRSKLSRVYHIDRGYEKIENKLNVLGANIDRIKS